MEQLNAEERFTATLRESVRAGIGGAVAMLPIPVFAALDASAEVAIAYLVVLILVLGTIVIVRRRRKDDPQ